MMNMYTKFEVLSRSRYIFGGEKFKMDHVTWPRPFQRRFIICRLGFAMFNPRIKFEMSTITCNEETKGDAKCKNSCFEAPSRDLGVTHRIHLWLDGKRVVDFLLAITAILASSHGCCTIKRNLSKSVFSNLLGHFDRKF